VSSLDFLTAAARQAAVMNDVGHRPWPVPDDPWVQAQTWEDLLFAHWRVDAAELARLLPPEVPPDTHDGTGWLGITPFRLTNLRLRGIPPLPRLSSFPELNVRTYATVDGKPGIWFFTLDAASQLAVEAAKRTYKLPYHRSRMSAERHGSFVHYESSRANAAFSARYRGEGDLFTAEEETLEYFLTERYCLYTADGGRLYRAEIHHPPWRLQRGEAHIDLNTMSPLPLPDEEPHLLFSPRQDVVVWSLEEIAADTAKSVDRP
jgi:uncharacterized protein YqjF (DUF2071 family)